MSADDCEELAVAEDEEARYGAYRTSVVFIPPIRPLPFWYLSPVPSVIFS